MESDARSARIDNALRQFLNANYPNDRSMWLRNRSAQNHVSPLDLRDIREAYREVSE